ncbi:hypothetical protein NQF86_00300 [Bombella sp. TMW 2.2543]|uniref:Secreted protein n=1 Tax=Bombella pluederhausensis TaxID=2967336 RepID=A0ABT3WHL5_9PROT|nr:hypothetical protein [Bombella pluederhausensis]MCX5617113.1 hypothetical protein [Bombella pluederhausensis]
MKHAFFAVIAVAALAGVARADILSHQPEPTGTLSQALRSEKIQEHRGQTHRDPQRDEENLRRLGLADGTAKAGMWALAHRPHSQCAQYIRQLTADADGNSAALLQSDQRLVVYLNNSGICER